jgi:RimJ/RimL family protein N-acetyltransferase
MSTEDPFKGERIYLRKLRVSDVDDRYLSWFQDQDLIKYYSGSKRAFDREAVLEELRKGEESGSHFMYGIFMKDIQLCIGNIKVGSIFREHKISDLPVLIGDRRFRGKGLATEAIQLGSRLAFDRYDIRKLSGGMYEDNIASLKAYMKAGWVTEGRLKGHYWVDGRPMDRVLVSCFSEKYFDLRECVNDCHRLPDAAL